MPDRHYVWVSSFRKDSGLILGFKTDRTDGTTGSSKAGLSVARSIWVGEVPPPDQLPERIWPGREGRRSLSPLFIVRGFIFVTHDAARILERFDLGGGRLREVAVLASEDATEIDETVFCWVFGNKKSALDLACSRLEHLVTDAPGEPYGFLPAGVTDGDIRVREEALSGPDVWYDPALIDALFLGRRLGEELEAAGLAKAFRLHRAPVELAAR